MLDTILYVFLTITNSPTYVPPYDVCKKDISHLSTSNQITFTIGCSENKGIRVYPDRILEDIYNGKEYGY
jgi:hypothetical protein